MTVSQSQVSVGTAATLVATGFVGASHCYLHSPTGGNIVYIGAANVTTSNGFALPKDEFHEIWLPETDKLYAVVTSGTETLYVIHTGGR